MVLLILLGLAVLGIAAAMLILGRSLPTAPDIAPVAGERTIRLSYGDVRYTDEGQGEYAVVFLHGFNGQLSHWNAVWERRPHCGRWVRLDIPGYGRSSVDSNDFTLATQVLRIREFLDSLGIRKATLVGGSMGGSTAAQFAATYPEMVHRVLLLAPSAFPGSLRYWGVFGAVLDHALLNRAAWFLVRTGAFRASFPHSRGTQALSVTSSYGEPWARALSRLRAPTIILWSRGDNGVSFRTARGVRDAIYGSELVWLDEASGHDVAGNRPELVAELTCRLFAGEVPPLGAASWLPGLLRPGENVDQVQSEPDAAR